MLGLEAYAVLYQRRTLLPMARRQTSTDSAPTNVVDALLSAYCQGAFPMADPLTGDIHWYSPDPRALIPIAGAPGQPGGIHLSRSLRAAAYGQRSTRFTITSDLDFPQVIRACAQPRHQPDGGAWINDQIIAAYTALHQAGHAHSLEAWRTDDAGQRHLVGGLYGVHIGAAFFGESMFCRPDLGGTDASKVCFVRLIDHLRALGVTLLDTQFENDHMAQFGLDLVARKSYLKRLREATSQAIMWQGL